jgi:biopolymer transport protein ExbD
MWMTKVRMAAAVLLTAAFGISLFLYAARTQAQARNEKKAFLPLADSGRAAASKLPEKPDDPVPAVSDLLAYLNDNARLVEGLCSSVIIDCRCGHQTVGLGGMLACQRPRDVRLQVKIFGQPAVDLGCNEEEYWYWLSKAEPPVPWRGRRAEETRSGPRHWPIPYRPEWLLDVLGIAEYDPAKTYSLRRVGAHLELSESVQSPQGQSLRKVIVFHRPKQNEGSQLAAVVWKTTDGKVLCRAEIKKVYTDRETGARLTQEAVVTFPDERAEVRFALVNPQIGKLPAERAALMFSPKSAFFAKISTAEMETKKKADAPVIRIDLTRDNVQARYGEDVLKLSGQPDGPLALRALQEQLRAWSEKEKQPAVLIACSADADYARLKAILAACREAGLRALEVRTGCRAAPD